MSIDSAISIAWDVLKSVVAPIKRQFGYVIYSKRHAQDLQKEVEELADEVVRVHNVAEEARNNLRNVYGRVTEWHASAEKALKEVRDLLGDFQETSKTCCYGTLPDPKCRYRFSRKARKKIEVIQRLTQKCSGFKELNDISFSNPAPGNVAALTPAKRDGISSSNPAPGNIAALTPAKREGISSSNPAPENVSALTPAKREGKDVVQLATVTASASFASTSNKVRDNDVFESRDSITRDIMDALTDDSNSVVGVHGMGGVGKSTLLADVERRIMEKKSFDWVTKADVSENPDIKKIQGEIADALGLTEIKNKETTSGRAKLLHGRLKDEEREKKKVLIILDNLWTGLDLKSVGIPCGHDNKVMGCKLLLTSRFQDVLRREMGCDRDFRLEELKDEEAKRLFESTVGDKVHDDPFKSLVNEAVHKCAGLPFLIITMANIFKDADFYEWKDVLRQIEKSTDRGMSGSINKMLQLSYDRFKGEDGEEVKSLLRLCVVYGVSKPSLENLVRYGVGLRLFQEDSTMEEIRNRLNTLIRKLKASSLLLADNEDVNGFKIHDLVRGFIALVASKDDPLLVLKDNDKSVIELPKDRLRSCTAVCFPYVDMKELPEELYCPEMRILLLFSNNESLKIPDSYFNSMRKLMVLHLSQVCLTRSPSPFQFLENLHTLCLDRCSLEDVAMIGELKRLHILSFKNSNIQRLPKEIGQLAELRLLDLNYCRQLKIIEPGVLGNLMKLEELYMENSFDRRDAVEQTSPTNAKLIELNNLKNLYTLHVSILDPSGLPEDLNIEKLTKYKIQIGDVTRWQRRKGSSILELKLDPISNILQKGFMQTFLGKTDDLFLDGLNGIEKSICVLSQKAFPNIKHLHVTNSPSVHYVLQTPSYTNFKMLESLILSNLINLEKICNNHISSNSFSALKVVQVESCNKMEVLFPLSLLIELPQLEEIRAIECHLMEEIVEVDDCGKVELHNLHVLELHDLPSIKNFFSPGTAPSSSASKDQVGTQVAFFNGQQVSIPSLESLKMSRLPNLENIWNKNPHGIVRLNNLKEVRVHGCDNLRFMFFPSMVQYLAQLRKLEVWHCKKMEAIIMEEEGLSIETSETLVFPMLTILKFVCLESLTCFSRKKCTSKARGEDCVKSRSTILFNQEVAFPNLETLYIEGMNNIEILWDNQVAVESFHKLKLLSIHRCNKLVNIVPSCILGRFRSLESMDIRSCGSLEVIFKLQLLNPLDGHPVAPFPLKVLELYGLPELKCVWDKELHSQVKFQYLRSITISKCKNLTSLFPTSVVVHLTQLEELEINECSIVELIEKEDGLVPKFVFPKLASLKLEHLTELKCIYIGKHASHWLALKTLEVCGCDKVEIFASHPENEMPLDKQPLFLIEKGAFSNLQELKLESSKWMEIWHGNFLNEELFHKLRVLELCCISKEFAMSACHFVQSLTNLEELLVCKLYLEELSINVEAVGGQSHELKVVLPFSRYSQHLKTLDVSHCDVSNMFTSAIVGNLVELTKLRISNCHMLIEVIIEEGDKERHVVAFQKLRCMELDGLIGLRCFSSGGYTLMFPLLENVTITRCPNMKFFSEGPIEAPKLERVQVSKVEWFWKGNLNTTIQSMFEQMGIIAGVKLMRLSEFSKLMEKWHTELIPINSYWHLKYLVVYKCPSFVNAIPSRLMLVLGKMKGLQVCDCESLEEIFNLEGMEAMKSTQVLPWLLFLDLVNLPKLRRLWNKNLQGKLHFNALTYLGLYNCSNLRHAFAPSMAQCLANLEQMVIKECGQMEGVIAEEEGQGSAVEKIKFMNLEEIKLECLPHFTSFLLGKNYILCCPRLQTLTIAHCSKMRSFTQQSLMEIDHDTPSLFNPQVQFPKLKMMVLSHLDDLSKIWTDSPRETPTFDCLQKIEAKNCKSLEKLFPRWVARSLSQIEELCIESCELEEIVAREDPPSNTAQFLFPKLTSLVLHDMPRLKSFCPSLPTLNWPSLNELRVTHCDKLNIFSITTSMNKWAQRHNQHNLSNHEAHLSLERDIPILERILLVDKDIQMILDGKFPDDIFGKPKALTLACFHDKKVVFPPRFLLERFRNLQSLEIFCSSFEDIFPDEGLVDEGLHPVLENLSELKLSKLHNIKRVWREDYLVEKILQSIETFEVWDCPSLTTIFPSTSSFRNLTELVVKNSFGLVHLATFSAITNLVHLTKMTIVGCERMKEVVANDGKGEGEVIFLEKLETLRLQNLPSLVCFCSIESCIFRFPLLDDIEVEECPKMKIFSKGTLSTPKLRFVLLFRHLWDVSLEGDLNIAIQKLSS